MTRRQEYAPLIFSILQETAEKPLKEQRKALRAAFPGPPGEHWPKRAWRDEIRRQKGLPCMRKRRFVFQLSLAPLWDRL